MLRLLLPTVRLLAPRKTFPPPSMEPTVRLGEARALMSISPLPNTSTRAVPPVEAPENRIWPPSPPPVPPLVMSIALPAVEEPLNWVEPPAAPLTELP